MGKKANAKKHNKGLQRKKKKMKFNSLDLVALVIFIIIGLGVIAGSVWYYSFHLPEAKGEMERITLAYVEEWYNVDHETITGLEGIGYLSATQAYNMRELNGPNRVSFHKELQLDVSIAGDVEILILEQGLKSGKTRAVFLQIEEKPSGREEVLYYYEFHFILEKGKWVINSRVVPEPAELAAFHKARGWEAPADDEDEED